MAQLSLEEPEQKPSLPFDPRIFIDEVHLRSITAWLWDNYEMPHFGRAALITKTLGRDDYFKKIQSLWETRMIYKHRSFSNRFYYLSLELGSGSAPKVYELAWMKMLAPEKFAEINSRERFSSLKTVVEHAGEMAERGSLENMQFLSLASSMHLLFPTYFPKEGLVTPLLREKILAHVAIMQRSPFPYYTKDLHTLAHIRLVEDRLYNECATVVKSFIRQGPQKLSLHSRFTDQEEFTSIAADLCILSAKDVIITPSEFRLEFDEPLEKRAPAPLPVLRNF